MSKLQRIETFISVVDSNGFASAARKKKVSTAAISRQFAALEQELGSQLIQRTTRKLTLTEAGKQYYQQCKKLLAGLQEAEAYLAASRQEATGVLRIMANRYFIITHLIPKLDTFLEQNPKLKLDFQLAERFPNLQEEGIDILYGVSIEGSPDLVRKKVTTTRYVLAGAPSYFKKYGMPTTPSDLHTHHYITHKMRDRNDIVTFKENQEVAVQPFLSLNDSQAMLACAIAGLGLVNLHDYIVEDAIRTGSLVEVLKEDQVSNQPVYLYYLQNRYLQPKIRHFIDFYTT